VSYITGSQMEKSQHVLYQWCCASCGRDCGLFTSKFCREIVAMSSTSPY